MPKKRPEAPYSPVEVELLEALARLEGGKLKDPTLLNKARMGKLRINPTTVAREAGRARTLIGHDGCAYPRVRAAIAALSRPETPVTSFEDVNRRLRDDNAELRRSVNVAMSRVAAMARRMAAVEQESKRRIAEAVRRAKAEKGHNANQIAGASLVRQPGVVVQLKKPKGEV